MRICHLCCALSCVCGVLSIPPSQPTLGDVVGERQEMRRAQTDVSQPPFVFLPITAGALGSEPLGGGPSDLYHHSL